MRNAEHGDAFGYEDGEMEKYHPELIENPFDDSSDMTWLYEAIDKLEPLKRERIKKHYIEGISVAEIADAEGVSFQSVYKSITRALKILEKNLANGWILPLWNSESVRGIDLYDYESENLHYGKQKS